MGAKTKAKAPALAVPQTDEEANTLLFEYGQEARVVAAIETEMNESLAKVKATYEALSKLHQERLNNHFDCLQAWAEANRTRLTEEGKVKTVALPSGTVHWRTRPPSIKLTGKVEQIVAAIKAARLHRFLRVKYELNKEAMLNDQAKAATVAGVKVISGVEDFCVEPVGMDLAEPVT